MIELDKICEFYGCTKEEINGPSRKPNFVIIRECLWKILYDKGYKHRTIADWARRDRTTVISGLATINNLLDIGDKTAILYWEKINNLVNSRNGIISNERS